MRVFILAGKDLMQIFRDKRSLLFLVLMPLVFTAFMGFAFGRGGGEPQKAKIAWVDEDNSNLSQQFRAQVASSETLEFVDTPLEKQDEAAEQVKSGKLAALVVVPAGFEAAAYAGARAQVLVSSESASSEGEAARQAVKSAWLRVQSAAAISRLASPDGDVNQRQAAFNQALNAWQQPNLSVRLESAVGTEVAGEEAIDNPYNQSSPGMMVQFAIFGLVNTALVLVLERKSKSLERMLTTTTSPVMIILGHLLAMFVVVFLQILLLIAYGQLAFQVNYLAEPLAVLLVAVALALCVASLGLLIGTLAKGEEQVIMLAMAAMFVFSALGGAWFPLEATGPAFSSIGHLTPGAWAMDGFQNVLLRGQGLAENLLPAGALLGYTLLFFLLALWRFRRSAQ